MTPAEFIAAIAPAAIASAKTTGVPVSFTIAQGALESGWGNKAPGNNLFGIKADKSWHGAVVIMHTHEVVNGVRVAVDDLFRAYPDWQGCMDDHGAFLRGNPRYAAAFNYTKGEHFCRAVAAAGYATDPDYVNKIISIMRHHNLAAFDSTAGAVKGDSAAGAAAPATNKGDS